MEDRWLPVSEIAEYPGVVRESVYRRIAKGSIQGRKLGRHRKFRKEEVDEWVKSGGADDRPNQNFDQQLAEENDPNMQ